jgi:purine-binding chemotaxis protein CheW
MTGQRAREVERRVLAERARVLAHPASEADRGADIQIVTFTLGGEAWGLEARLVWEVFRMSELARLPGAEAPVTGITPWRGLILPVLDLRSVLGIPSAPLDDLRFAVVVGTERPALGILADAVDEVRSVGEGELGQPPEGVTRHREHLLGVTPGALPVLDGARLVERYG